MGRKSANSSGGFSLIELLVALAVGALVVGAAVQLFSQGMDATFVVSQRAEMQQDLRASSDLLFKDISLAGAGLPSATGIQLPSQAGKPIYGSAPSCAAQQQLRPRGRHCLSLLLRGRTTVQSHSVWTHSGLSVGNHGAGQSQPQ